jgi:hypothetical protein
LSVWRVRNHYYNQKKKVLVVCLAGARSLLQPEKKDTNVYLVGAKQDTVVCLAGARSKNIDQKKQDTVIWLCTKCTASLLCDPTSSVMRQAADLPNTSGGTRCSP